MDYNFKLCHYSSGGGGGEMCTGTCTPLGFEAKLSLAMGSQGMEERDGQVFNEPEDQQQQFVQMEEQVVMDEFFMDLEEDHFPITQENGSVDEQYQQNSGGRKRHNHRHTIEQIQGLEEYFRQNPHPDETQRRFISQDLGLEPQQVKFWFQNKRTQIKNQMEHEENLRLKEENTQLLIENVKLKGALETIRCSNCGQPPTLGEKSIDELIVENAGMREKIEMMMGLISKYTSRPLRTPSVLLEPPVAELNLILNRTGPGTEKPAAHVLAVEAMEELLAMAHRDAPLWVPGKAGLGEALNEEEYARAFPGELSPNLAGLGTEASRATAIVAIDAARLVDILMDVSKWSAFFSSIVAGATYITGYSIGTGESHDGSLQLITAEFQAPSPLVALREGMFLRHCKLHDEGLWAVVDVSLEVSPDAAAAKFRRRPSGCIIQQLPDDRSKVIWVEHVEVEAGGIHDMYKPIVNSGLVFGAKRWLATLSKQCERMANLMASNSTAHIVGDAVATKNILKLSDRMVVSFFSGVSGSVLHQWADRRNVGMNDVKIRGRKNHGDPGRPSGIVLSASTSIWLPIPPKRLFDFLRDVPSRNQWDVLLNGSMLREEASINNGQDEQGNCISIFNVGLPEEGRRTMMLQEICSGPICSFVIYTPIDSVIINAVLGGADPNFVALLPSGFVIHPDGPSGFGDDEAKQGGSLLTVAFQISMHSLPNSMISVVSIATVNNLLASTCARIRAIALAK